MKIVGFLILNVYFFLTVSSCALQSKISGDAVKYIVVDDSDPTCTYLRNTHKSVRIEVVTIERETRHYISSMESKMRKIVINPKKSRAVFCTNTYSISDKYYHETSAGKILSANFKLNNNF